MMTKTMMEDEEKAEEKMLDDSSNEQSLKYHISTNMLNTNICVCYRIVNDEEIDELVKTEDDEEIFAVISGGR